MKRIAFILLLTVFIINTAMHTQTKRKIIFFGDSITQMGINNGGYIDLLKKYAQQQGVDKQYELLSAGIGGNKIYDLYLRMQKDVLDKKPTHVLIYIGINDIWHKTSGIGTAIDTYEKFYVALIKKMQQQKIKLLLCTPSVIGEKKNGANPQDADLDAYSSVIRKLAEEYNCTLIDLRKTFMEYENVHNPDDKELGILTTDKVHLNDKGNQLVADAITPYLFN